MASRTQGLELVRAELVLRMLRHALVVSALLLLAACSTRAVGEFGEVLCSNTLDDDDDGLKNCDDPDCFGAEVCRKHNNKSDAATKMDAGSAMDAGSKTDAGDAGSKKDAGHPFDSGPAKMDAVVDDSDGSSPPDAGPITCKPDCATTEECVAGKCQPVAANKDGMYTLRIVSATVPNESLSSMCYDSCLPAPVFFTCDCLVDPYVKVVLVHQNGRTVDVGTTQTIADDVQPMFDAATSTFNVTLAMGDVLRFEVRDDDSPAMDQVIGLFLFSCKPDLTGGAGPLSCSVPAGVGGLTLAQVNAELKAVP